MTFEPYTLAIGPWSQAFSYLFRENYTQAFVNEKLTRELFVLKDGGTVALDWDQGIPDPKDHPTKPIMLMIPGVSGDSEGLYHTELLRQIRDRYKVVIFVCRGSGGLTLTSPRLNSLGSWVDLKPIIEYLNSKYIGRDAKGQKRTRLYAFGASLGGSMIGRYLAEEGEEAKKVIDAASIYGSSWEYDKGGEYFYGNYYGLPEICVCLNLLR